MDLKVEVNSTFLKNSTVKKKSHFFLIAVVSAFTERKGGVRHGSPEFLCFC